MWQDSIRSGCEEDRYRYVKALFCIESAFALARLGVTCGLTKVLIL